MSHDRPTESISGNGEWRWRRLQASNRPASQPDESTKRRELEAELERREQQLQVIIQQYERRLAETERQLARERTTSDADDRMSVRSKLAQLLSP